MNLTRTNHGALVPAPAMPAPLHPRLQRCAEHPGGGLHCPVVECAGDAPSSAFCYWCGADTPWNTWQGTPTVMWMVRKAGLPARIPERHGLLYRDAVEAIG